MNMVTLPTTFRVAMRANVSRYFGAAAFSTSASAAMASPATEQPPKMKTFKIYRWVRIHGVWRTGI